MQTIMQIKKRRSTSWSLLRMRCIGLAGVLALSCIDNADAQTFPVKPIRIVTSGVGGGNDFAARIIAAGITTSLGQQVIVDNRPGASGIIAAQAVINAPADGYTLLLYTGSIWTLPFMKDNVPYDPVRDFAPISIMVNSPDVLVVHAALAVKSVKDLIALARAHPGQLNNAGGETGSTTHLPAVLFNAMAHVNITYVPYKNGATRMTDLIGGQVQMMFATPASVLQYVRNGKLRALAVTGAQPSSQVPGLTTLANAGVPGYEAVSAIAMLAPARTPEAVVNRLNQDIVAFINTPTAKDVLLKEGLEIVGSTPAQAAVYIKSDMGRWQKVIKDAGIRAD